MTEWEILGREMMDRYRAAGWTDMRIIQWLSWGMWLHLTIRVGTR